MMDLATLANLGEAIGGVAVVVSLVYLSFQIRTNTKTVRASNYINLVGNANEFNSAIIDPATAAIWVSGLSDYERLNAEDQARFGGVISLLFNAAQRAHHLHETNLLGDEMWESLAHTVDVLLENEGTRQWWEANQHWFPIGFRAFANRKLASRIVNAAEL